MLREMGEVLDRYTERRPLLLVTEDLHWSDRATIQLIDYIARRRGSARFMWLASFRLAEVVALDHPLNPLRHELRLHGLCEEIVLDSFSETEVADYVAERSPSLAGDEAFVRALHERTDGVPLFVASVMSDVMRASCTKRVRTLLPRRNSRTWRFRRIWRTSSIITSPSWQTSGARCSRRPAVCGVEFRVNTVSDALERDAAWVGQTCDELAREQLWLSAPRAEQGSDVTERPYSFRHALFRQVLYERTAPVVPRAAPPQSRRRARTGACRRRAGRCCGARYALRARPRADDRIALLRRGCRSGAAAPEPGRVHERSPSAG